MPCDQTTAILTEWSLCDEVKLREQSHRKDVQNCNHVTNIELNSANDNMSEYKQPSIEQRESLQTQIIGKQIMIALFFFSPFSSR